MKKQKLDYKHIEALSKISKAITSDLYLEDILKLIVTVTAQLLDSKICSIMLLDEKGEKLVIKATCSISEEYNKKPPLKIGEGIAGKVVQENKPKTILNVVKEKEYKYKDIAKKEGLRSLLCLPLTVKGKVIGVLNAYTPKTHRFTNEEIKILTAVANQAAIVIENAELLVQSKVFKEELETRKMVERAKGILMKDLNLSEEEAYGRLQRCSMDSRKTMRDIAEAIIMSRQIKKTSTF